MAENTNRANEIEEVNTHTMPDYLKPGGKFNAGTDSQPWSAPNEDPLLDGTRQQLYRAAMEGDWETAQKIFEKYKIPKTLRISALGMTALHVAACGGKSEFVRRIVEHLDPKDLEMSDFQGRTALHYVAIAAKVSAAETMVRKNKELPQLRDINSDPPIMYAARWRHRSKVKRMVEYLCEVTQEDEEDPIFSGLAGANLVVAITASGCYDVALHILKKHPELASARNEEGMSILHVFAMRPLAFREGHELSLWESFIYKVVYKEEKIDGSNVEHPQPSAFVRKLSRFIKGMKVLTIMRTHTDSLKLVKFVCMELQKKKDSEFFRYFLQEYNGNTILHLAVENGVSKLVEVCLKCFPELIWQRTKYRTLLHDAIEHRRVDIFNHLIDLIGGNTRAYADMNFENNNNILHLAAKHSAPLDQLMIHSVPGPTFLMQRELQWFKAVEALVYEELTMEKNKTKKKNKGQVPRELFFKEHGKLLGDAKQWMKETSNSCMLVATLVATVAFAAMITVPGGNDNNTGLPILSNRKLFMAFCISDTLSMISSAVTLLMFVSVYTSRFTENDFMFTFPNILLIGLISLFIAVATMMVAFGTAIGLALQNRVKWAYIPITVLACCPALIFTKLQLPLLFQTIVFASGPGIYRPQRVCKSRLLNKIGYCPLSKDMC